MRGRGKRQGARRARPSAPAHDRRLEDPTLKIFVTGGTGYIGSAVVPHLVDAGLSVTGLARSEKSAQRLEVLGATPHHGDLAEVHTFAPIAASHDVVVHIALEGSREGVERDRATVSALLEVLHSAGGPRHLIYTSGIWVLGPTDDAGVDETGATDLAPRLVHWRPPNERQILMGHRDDVATAVVRPGMVYGGNAGLFRDGFAAAAAGEPVPYVGDGLNYWSPIHRDDLAAYYGRVVECRASGVFHAVDREPTRVRKLAEEIGTAAGSDAGTTSIPLETARETRGRVADALCMSQVVRTTRANELGWTPRYPTFADGAGSVLAGRK